jgi:general secretion pathway protein J
MRRLRVQYAAAECGFTLIELLVSLGLFGLMSALLLMGLGSMRLVTERGKRQSATGQSIVTAQTILRDRIENMVASTRFDTLAPVVDLRGGTTIVSFFAPAPPAERPTTVLRYRLLRSAPGDVVLYAISDLSDRVNAYAPGQSGWTPTVLLTGVESLDLDYFGAAPPDNRPRWRNEWVERQQPPELIRIRVSFKQGDTRRWPELIVRPAATVNSSCRIDDFTGRCVGAS